jgi:hypothetical protein
MDPGDLLLGKRSSNGAFLDKWLRELRDAKRPPNHRLKPTGPPSSIDCAVA